MKKGERTRLLWKEALGLCHYCGRETWLPKGSSMKCKANGKMATQDHVVPLVHGGTSCMSNLVLSCVRCNSMKRSFPYEVFRTWVNWNMTRKDWEEAQRKAARYKKIYDGDRRFRAVLRYRGIRAYC